MVACMFASCMGTLLSGEDRHLLNRTFIGCTSGETLPVPTTPSSGMNWLSWLISLIDVEALVERRAPFDAGIGALHALIEALNDIKSHLQAMELNFEDQGPAFIDLLEHVGATVSLSHPVQPYQQPPCADTGGSTRLQCSVDPACRHGRGCVVDEILNRALVDAQARLELGLFHTDLSVRRGRHHLRHLLNAGRHIVVFDSSAEEGGGPSAPLAEWLSEVQRNRMWDGMREAPDFLSSNMYEGEEVARPFTWKVREEGHGSWLTPVSYATLQTDRGLRFVRQGFSGRDKRQQLGLDLHAHLQANAVLNHPNALLTALEGEVQGDRRRRQPLAKRIEAGQTFDWTSREVLASVDAIDFPFAPPLLPSR